MNEIDVEDMKLGFAMQHRSFPSLAEKEPGGWGRRIELQNVKRSVARDVDKKFKGWYQNKF